jgi:hypothetical protein
VYLVTNPLTFMFQEEFADTKGVIIRIHKSKKDRQHNHQKKYDKRTNNYLPKHKKSSNTNPTKNQG